MGEAEKPSARSVTSEGLSNSAVTACWIVAALLMGSGIAATFLAGTGAAPAAMILFGSLFLVLALMRRVPLSLEVGGAKFDASYETDVAFTAGHDAGLQQGVEVALSDVERAEQSGEPAHVALERRVAAFQLLAHTLSSPRDDASVTTSAGYRPPVACSAAGITYRQLDYWARSGLIEPSIRDGSMRLYSETDIVLLRVVKELLDAGVSLQQIRTAIDHMRQREAVDLARITFISDGASVYETTTDAEILDLLGSGRGMYGISVQGVVREVRQALAEMPTEPHHALPDQS